VEDGKEGRVFGERFGSGREGNSGAEGETQGRGGEEAEEERAALRVDVLRRLSGCAIGWKKGGCTM